MSMMFNDRSYNTGEPRYSTPGTGRHREALTPENRARVLADLDAQAARTQRQIQDSAHLPGDGADPVVSCAYWERKTDAMQKRFDDIDQQWRDAAAAAGEFPDDREAAQIHGLAAQRSVVFDEYQRCRDNRDMWLSKLDYGLDAPTPPAGWREVADW